MERGGAQTLVKNIGGLERRLSPHDTRHPTDTEGKKKKKKKRAGKQTPVANKAAEEEVTEEQNGVEIDDDVDGADDVAEDDEATPDGTDSETGDGGAEVGDLGPARLSGGQY